MNKNDLNMNALDQKTIFVPDDLKKKWNDKQFELRRKLILDDTEPWQINLMSKDVSNRNNNTRLKYVAGLDLSFMKDNDDEACAGLVVLDIENGFEVVYEDISMVKLDYPYVAGYLAFREAPCLIKKLKDLKFNKPHLYPQCLFIDGNGVLHPKKFGFACHIGVLTDTPSIGIAKKLLQIHGLKNDEEHMKKVEFLKTKGDYFELKNAINDELFGYCINTGDENQKNIKYVSPGHKMSFKTCFTLINKIIKDVKSKFYEPTMQADLRTRRYLTDHYPNQSKKTVDLLNEVFGLNFKWPKTVYVSNLANNVKWQELKDLFSNNVGEVYYCKVFPDLNIGLVEFKTEEDTVRSVDIMNQFQFRGKNISVVIDSTGYLTRKALESTIPTLKSNFTMHDVDKSAVINENEEDHKVEWKNAIFITNMPVDFTKNDLTSLLKKHQFKTIFNRVFERNGETFGAIVEFKTNFDSKSAINKLNGLEIKSRKLVVTSDEDGRKTKEMSDTSLIKI